MPFLAKQLSARETANKMFAAKNLIETAHTAARIYIRENKNNLTFNSDGVHAINSNNFYTLEPYGLPLGFNAKTVFGQNISLEVRKIEKEAEPGEEASYKLDAYLKIDRGSLSDYQMAELVRMVGFFAQRQGNYIKVAVPVENKYSDIVLKLETDENIGFLTSMNMEYHNIKDVKDLYANNGSFEEDLEVGNNVDVDSLTVTGISGEEMYGIGSEGNKITNLIADVSHVFGNLNVKSGDLNTDSAIFNTLGKSGSSPDVYSTEAKVNLLSQATKDDMYGNFAGPNTWDIYGGNLEAKTLSAGSMIINGGFAFDSSGFSGMSTGEFSTESALSVKAQPVGINAGTLSVSRLILYNKSVYELTKSAEGTVWADIALDSGNISIFPDIYDTSINNNKILILWHPFDDDNTTLTCGEFLQTIFGESFPYNIYSVSQNIICQYVYWERLERRLNIKNCRDSGSCRS